MFSDAPTYALGFPSPSRKSRYALFAETKTSLTTKSAADADALSRSRFTTKKVIRYEKSPQMRAFYFISS
jgi:hypothetical protein